MKKNTTFLLQVIILLFLCSTLPAQPYMYLDEQFKAASEPMKVKRKGIGAVGRYEFGPYKIISGKSGWTKTREETGFISGDTHIASETRKSFVFTGSSNDTVTANILIASAVEIKEQYGFIFRTLTNWSDREVTESTSSYVATFISNSDTGRWNLVLVHPDAGDITGDITAEMMALFQGTLSNPQMNIEIEPVFQWENGDKSSFLKPLESYRFILKGTTVAAVQVYPYPKMVAWIRNDLENNLKLILAAGVASMLVRSNSDWH